MTEALHEDVLRALRDVFEERIKRRLAQRRPVWEEEPNAEDHLAFVLPMSAEEVGLLAEVAERYSVPLVALGARTSPSLERGAEKGSILVRFDLMRRTRLPADFEEPWVRTCGLSSDPKGVRGSSLVPRLGPGARMRTCPSLSPSATWMPSLGPW